MMVDGLRARVRARQLAGDGRAGVWARNRSRDVHWRWVERNRRFVVSTVAGAVGISSLLAYLIPSPFVVGLMVGAISVATFAMLAMMITLTTGTAYRSMGATAETWTASELRPLRRHGWRIVNHLVLGRSDIDHVLLGSGGVLAVETKWSASPWVLEPPSPKVREAIVQVQRNAKNLKYWYHLKSAGLTDVESVVFLWGYDDTSHNRPSRPVVIDGTTLIASRQAAEAWRADLITARVTTTPEQADNYWRAVDAQIRSRDARDAVHEPPRPSLFAIYWQATGALVAAVAGAYTFAEMLRLKPAPLAAAAIAAMTGLGLLARHVSQIRIIALGWLTALALCITAFGCLEAATRL